MSKPNKVNKNHYDQAGRLTPDDMARERKRQSEVAAHSGSKERITAKADKSARAVRGASRPRSAPEE